MLPRRPGDVLCFGGDASRFWRQSLQQDAREFLELAAEVPLQTEIEIFDLEQANPALQALKKSEIKGAAVLRISAANARPDRLHRRR